jgi:hypothetical protein
MTSQPLHISMRLCRYRLLRAAARAEMPSGGGCAGDSTAGNVITVGYLRRLRLRSGLREHRGDDAATWTCTSCAL